MLNRILILITFVFLFTCLFSNCKKDVNKPAVDQLPAATHTGANTFGCLVNGEVVIIHKPFGDLSPAYGCQYQSIYPTVNGYSFNVYGTDKKDGGHFKSVEIGLDSIQLEQTTYSLNTPYIAYGRHGLVDILNGEPPSPLLTYVTDSITTGQVTITYFDQQNQIVSGTFWFNAIEENNGDTVHVTDGRFDMNYTQ